jgi:hypothetical protein
MSNAQWKAMQIVVTDTRGGASKESTISVDQALTDIMNLVQSMQNPPLLAVQSAGLCNTCDVVHDLIPAGYPQCTTLPQHMAYVVTAWENSVGTDTPDWSVVRTSGLHVNS